MCSKHQIQLESSKIKQLIVSGRLHPTDPLLQASTTRFDIPSQKILDLPTLSTTTCIKPEPNMLILFLPALPKKLPIILILFSYHNLLFPYYSFALMFQIRTVLIAGKFGGRKVWLIHSFQAFGKRKFGKLIDQPQVINCKD